ncbi:MAG: GDSL-type esterase/lipase family protein [Agriterribacter sp.]
MKHCLFFISFFLGCIVNAIAQDTIHHRKPLFISKEINRVAKGTLYHYQCRAFDSSSRSLTYWTQGLPHWLQFNTQNNSLTGKTSQPGQYLIQLYASNGTDTAKQIFMLTVYDQETTNILCLGNSITNGTNKYNSYRRDLWKLLHRANYNFDLVGSWSKHHMGGDVPDPDFDMDHDGHSGWTFAEMFQPPSWDSARGNIKEWLTQYTPDIVLIELGTNDVFQCRKTADMITDLDKLVKLLRSKKSGVKIFVAQIPPLGDQWATKKLCGDSVMYDTRIHQLNKAIAIFVKKVNTSKSPVVAVDQYTNVTPSTMMYDDIHPNDAGEKVMAEKWYTAIHGYLKKIKTFP